MAACTVIVELVVVTCTVHGACPKLEHIATECTADYGLPAIGFLAGHAIHARSHRRSHVHGHLMLRGQRQGESSELESAFYVFLYWATRDQLHWRHAHFDSTTWSGNSLDCKCSAMSFLFEEKVLGRIVEEELRDIAVRLHALFFPDGRYNASVSSGEFLQAMRKTM